MSAVLYAFMALLGLAIGSFLNVVIYRVPAKLSIVSPPSACPKCGQQIRNRHNIPVLGWLVLRGKCFDCGEPISVRYPLVEAANGVLFVVMAYRFGFEPVLPAYLYFAAMGLTLALIDVDTKKLPNVITLPSYPVAAALLGIAGVAKGDYHQLVRAVICGAIAYAFYFLLVFVYPAGMGWGDVKLSGVLGAYLGWVGYGALGIGLFGGFLYGGVAGIYVLLFTDLGRKYKVPFGPFMLAGGLTGVLVGQQLFHAYTSNTLG